MRFEEESNDWTSAYTRWDMEVLITGSGITDIKPMRLRFRPSNGLLYIPCQDKDGIVVFDPVAESAVWKGGFDSPVDVVFTPTKAFAVQTGPIGLKEIT